MQVLVLAGVLIGLSRLAGRPADPGAGAVDPASAGSAAADRPAEMTSAAPDLTFYRTLGDGKPGAGAPSLNNNDAPPPRAPAAAADGAFVVQALATRDAAAARRLRDRLASRGFPSTLSEDRAGGRPVYRVRVGRYRSRPEA